MSEKMPKRGDYVRHDPTGDEGVVSGWCGDQVFIFVPGRKEQIPEPGLADELTILIPKEKLVMIDKFLPNVVQLEPQPPESAKDSKT